MALGGVAMGSYAFGVFGVVLRFCGACGRGEDRKHRERQEYCETF